MWFNHIGLTSHPITSVTKNNQRKNKTGSAPVKQLARQLRNMAVSSPKRKNRQPKQQQRMTGPLSNVPVANSYAITNRSLGEGVNTYQGTQTIGSVSYDTQDLGLINNFSFNPTLMGGRLARLAESHQKYRFKRMSLMITPGLPTTVGGNLVAGYTPNPDDDVRTIDEILSLPGAKLMSLWQAQQIQTKIEDPNSWYFCDPDSSEIMKTTQGKFVVGNAGASGFTTRITIPIVIDYVIQFKGAASGRAIGGVIECAETNGVPDPDNTNAWSIDNQPTAIEGQIQFDRAYALSGGVSLKGPTAEIFAQAIQLISFKGAGTYLLFAESFDALKAGDFITPADTGTPLTQPVPAWRGYLLN